ncbi:HmuY family protein [Sorangium sp. So ce1014]|uniref:HmuY family protein n=1 Tax=Sorangium sp. So ce1014 TaxID=3133326 RepID=UPI003F5FE75F
MRSASASALLAAGVGLLALCACGSGDPPSSPGAAGAGAGPGAAGAGAGPGAGAGGGASAGSGGTTTAPEPACSQPTPVPCEDDVFQQMNLQSTVAPGELSNEQDGEGYRSLVDATAGGAFAAEPDAYVYARFTDGGLEKVEISDEASLGSMDWDVAFRRYVVRINSGHSGPSCVMAARLPGTPDYDALAEAPGELRLRSDEYFTESCELIADGSGLESPATALSGYWKYPGCVEMSGVVYVVRLADGRRLKLTVTHFYNEEAQAQCQETGMVEMGDTGAANLRLRWAFLP